MIKFSHLLRFRLITVEGIFTQSSPDSKVKGSPFLVVEAEWPLTQSLQSGLAGPSPAVFSGASVVSLLTAPGEYLSWLWAEVLETGEGRSGVDLALSANVFSSQAKMAAAALTSESEEAGKEILAVAAGDAGTEVVDSPS